MEIEFLGTGTSTGVPMLRCHCPVCMSADPRDQRLRTSAIVRYQGVRFLIDCGPDFRTQMLRASDDNLDAVLLTHIHYDHVAGLDDLRTYCFERQFPLYARADVLENLHRRIPYCFPGGTPYPGVAQFEEHVIGDDPFLVEGVRVEPIPVMHYKLPICGFRIGPLAYITDAKEIADEVVDSLRGVPLLVINALRIKPHISHMCLDETLAIVERVKPGRTLLVHMSDGIGFHADSHRLLPQGVELAYDGLIVKV
ncbi:MAG: MBL fold metallo-hydrolase [Muribaculaceae bacterium]|nr:MBL fold metallo-hydrolase [Muribaculaceae bacterium]